MTVPRLTGLGPPAGAAPAGAVPLVAAAHGSRDPRAAVTVEAILAGVRRARPGLPVTAAYLDHAPPTLPQALAGLAGGPGRSDTVVVLPLLLTEAYHSRVDIPSALREAAAGDPGPRVRYGTTLGPHPLLLSALERRLAEAGVTPGDPDTAVVLVSAGSSDAGANAVIADMAREWARRRTWWSVTPAYASAASPTPAEAVTHLKRAGAPRVAVAPYLLAPGHFAERIERTSLAAGADTIAPVLGPSPELTTVILARYTEALGLDRLPAPA
jgi:sirohydrochlorin ferrochelatase